MMFKKTANHINYFPQHVSESGNLGGTGAVHQSSTSYTHSLLMPSNPISSPSQVFPCSQKLSPPQDYFSSILSVGTQSLEEKFEGTETKEEKKWDLHSTRQVSQRNSSHSICLNELFVENDKGLSHLGCRRIISKGSLPWQSISSEPAETIHFSQWTELNNPLKDFDPVQPKFPIGSKFGNFGWTSQNSTFQQNFHKGEDHSFIILFIYYYFMCWSFYQNMYDYLVVFIQKWGLVAL